MKVKELKREQMRLWSNWFSTINKHLFSKDLRQLWHDLAWIIIMVVPNVWSYQQNKLVAKKTWEENKDIGKIHSTEQKTVIFRFSCTHILFMISIHCKTRVIDEISFLILQKVECWLANKNLHADLNTELDQKKSNAYTYIKMDILVIFRMILHTSADLHEVI